MRSRSIATGSWARSLTPRTPCRKPSPPPGAGWPGSRDERLSAPGWDGPEARYETREAVSLAFITAASALKRARATLAREVPKPDQPAPAANSPAEQQLLSRLVQAFEDSDVQAVVALLTDDVWVRMPPGSLEYAFDLFVITLAGERVSAITRFDSGVFARFGLLRTLPD